MPDPTVTDVFNQLVLVNGKLSQVEVNTSLMANLNMSINAGFAATVGRLDTLAAIDVEAVKLLFHQTQQMDTMICMLEQISRNTCQMLNELAVQTELQKRTADDLALLRYIAVSTNSAAALEFERHKELEAKIERCCPPDRPDPACKHVPCDRPKPVEEPKLPDIPRPDQKTKPEG